MSSVNTISEPAVVDAHRLHISTLQQADRDAVRRFVEDNAALLQGRTLDYGCGGQPYRDLCGFDYVGYDPGVPGCQEVPLGDQYDAILCTCAIQEVEYPGIAATRFNLLLKRGGHLLITYHPSWYEVQEGDKWRFSKHGMEALMEGFEVVSHEPLVVLQFTGFQMKMTYGFVGRRK